MMLAYGTRYPCDETHSGKRKQPLPCPQSARVWVLVTAILGSSLAFIEGSVVNLALPAIQSGLGATSTDLQWVINAYLLMLGSFMLIGGSLGDRYGLRRVFMLGTGIFAAGALGCAVAPSLLLLIIARLVQGFGGALLVPNSLALIGSHFDQNERSRAIGTWAGASALTTASGPVLGGLVVDHWGWRAVFFLIPLLALLTLLIAAWRIPASPYRHDHKLDYLGALLLAAALALLIYALVHSGAPVQRVVVGATALLAAAAFIWRERRFATPMLPLNLFRSRPFSGANLMTLLLYCALSSTLYFLPFDLIQVQGYSARQAGAALLPFTLILGFGSTLAGNLIRRFCARHVLTLGPFITAMGFTALALPGTNASYMAGFLPGIILIGIGMTLSVAPLTAVVLGSVNDHHTGVASGINNTAARLAGVIAIAVLTIVAVNRFAHVLEHQLRLKGTSAALVKHLVQNASQLAELTPPKNTPTHAAVSARQAIHRAYVSTFRLVVIICGILAATSGVIAWLSLAPGKHAPDETATTRL